MHVLERFALGAGAKIDKPYIYESFFPCPYEKYIVFHPSMSAHKNYKHWQEVINILNPLLENEGIKIVQVGPAGKRDGNKQIKTKVYNGTVNLTGQTTISNAAFLVKNSLLSLGFDGFISQIAGHYNKKVVSLYSHVLKSHKKPFWGDEENQILIEPDREGRKPSYHVQDKYNDISKVCPFYISSCVCKLLNINFNYDFKTVFKGESSSFNFVDLIPNRDIKTYGGHPHLMRIRMDLEHNEEIMLECLKQSVGKVSLLLEKTIDIEKIIPFSEKIHEITFLCKKENLDDLSEQFIKHLGFIGVERVAFVSNESKEVINKFKYNFMDCLIVNEIKDSKKEDLPIELEEGKEYFYISSKRLLSDGKIYLDEYSYKNNKPVNTFNQIVVPLEDSVDFWKELPFISILEKNIDK